MNHRTISTELLKKEISNSITLSLVQFTTEWSGACQIILPVYEDLAKTYQGSVNFYSIDAGTEQAVSREYGIIEYPTILFFRNGEVVDHAVGLIPKNILIAKIEHALIN
jgi:thioredoxin 1